MGVALNQDGIVCQYNFATFNRFLELRDGGRESRYLIMILIKTLKDTEVFKYSRFIEQMK